MLTNWQLAQGRQIETFSLELNEARQSGQKRYHHPFPDNAFVLKCWRFLCTQLMVGRPWLIIDGGAYSATSPQFVLGRQGRLGMWVYLKCETCCEKFNFNRLKTLI